MTVPTFPTQPLTLTPFPLANARHGSRFNSMRHSVMECFKKIALQLDIYNMTVESIYDKWSVSDERDEITPTEMRDIMFEFNLDGFVKQVNEIVNYVDVRKGSSIQMPDFKY